MRIAFAGKGGSGKSTIVGAFARTLAATGEPVLVLDTDVMPGLAGALGVESIDAPIPDEAVEAGEEGGPRYRLRDGLTAEDAVEKYALRGPDGVRLLQLGKLRQGSWTIAASQFAFQQIVRELPEDRWHLIGDLPGGTRQPFFGWGGYAQTIVTVVEPTVKSYVTARRLRRLGDTENAPRIVVIANKVQSPDDEQRIADETGLEVIGTVPYDDAVRDADRAGIALVDHAPDSPAAVAIRWIVSSMQQEAVT